MRLPTESAYVQVELCLTVTPLFLGRSHLSMSSAYSMHNRTSIDTTLSK